LISSGVITDYTTSYHSRSADAVTLASDRGENQYKLCLPVRKTFVGHATLQCAVVQTTFLSGRFRDRPTTAMS